MKKIFITILVLALSSFCFAETLKINSDANVRSLPSKDGNVIEILTEGTKIDGEKSSENPDWYAITTTEGTTGYIHKSLVDSVISTSDINNAIIPFKSGLFWWIVIDKLILIGVFLYFLFTHKIGKGFLWALICLGCTLLLAFIFTLLTGELFVVVFGYVALLCVGVSPFILLITIVFLKLIWAMGTKSEPKLKAITYWVEE